MIKKVAIVIPHYNGVNILLECLESLEQLTYKYFHVYIVDNGSTDSSISEVKKTYPKVTIFELGKNLGYAGGCNYGYEHTEEAYILFLNNDTIHEKDFLDYMIEKIEKDERIGAVQPKLKSYYRRSYFDYSGACGGEIDCYGYPFARGRVFNSIEKDYGQYDNLKDDIFWASGTAFLVRRKALDEVGPFDEFFFAHMEEIDLCWRLQQFGWRIKISSQAVVYHHSGYTLEITHPQKTYLNHRNNLLMFYKNIPRTLQSVLYKRYFFEFLAGIFFLIKLDLSHSLSVYRAFRDYLKMKKKVSEKKGFIQRKEAFDNLNIYPNSIVYFYFIKKIKTYSKLLAKRK